MPITDATVLQLFIASPSDVTAERDAVRRAVGEWNELHGREMRVFIHAVGWDMASGLYGKPQASIEFELLDDSDLLIGIFWKGVGNSKVSGQPATIREIMKFKATRRPYEILFKDEAVPPSEVDSQQTEYLNELKAKLKAGRNSKLYFAFANADALRADLSRMLTQMVRKAISDIGSVKASVPTSQDVRDMVTSKLAAWETPPAKHRLTDTLNRSELDLAATEEWSDENTRLFLLAGAIQQRYRCLY
jgi:hypothetical protein